MSQQPKKKLTVEDEIQHVLSYLRDLEPDDEAYSEAVKNLKELYEARAKKKARVIEWESVLAVLGGITQVVLILHWEDLHVISSKGLGFVRKLF